MYRCVYKPKVTVKYGGGSILLWGCFSASCQGGTNHEQRKICGDFKENFKLAIKLGLGRCLIFQHDNDPKHFFILMNYLQRTKVNGPLEMGLHLWWACTKSWFGKYVRWPKDRPYQKDLKSGGAGQICQRTAQDSSKLQMTTNDYRLLSSKKDT